MSLSKFEIAVQNDETTCFFTSKQRKFCKQTADNDNKWNENSKFFLLNQAKVKNFPKQLKLQQKNGIFC